jgi:hypothetical protein
MFGEGEATFSGARLRGAAAWANFARVLTDGSTRPQAVGSLTTHDGATVLFRIGGKGDPVGGRAVHVLTFETDDDRYACLNEVVAVGEGALSAECGTLEMRFFECVDEHEIGH